MNALLGTKFKIILGYPGGNDINLAMERGEVGGRGSNSWASWKAHPARLAEGEEDQHPGADRAQQGARPAGRAAAHGPRHEPRGQGGAEAALRALDASAGRSSRAPGVPEDRVKALRDAFDATMKDPAFIAEAEKAQLELDPVSGRRAAEDRRRHRRDAEADRRAARLDHRRGEEIGHEQRFPSVSGGRHAARGFRQAHWHEPKGYERAGFGKFRKLPTPYDAFMESEGIPVFRDIGISKVQNLPLMPWKRTGGRGSYIQLWGTERQVGLLRRSRCRRAARSTPRSTCTRRSSSSSKAAAPPRSGTRATRRSTCSSGSGDRCSRSR